MKRKLAALLLAALCALGAVGLVGCGGPSAEEVIREGVTAEFEAVVDTESEEYRELVDALEQAGDLATYGVDEKAFMDSMYEGFAYEIGDIAVDEEAGTAVVDVKLTCKTFAEIFNTMMEDALALAEDPAAATMTQDELNAKLGEVMMGAVDGAELQETELKLDVVRDDDGTWNWDDTAEDEVTAALMGDF